MKRMQVNSLFIFCLSVLLFMWADGHELKSFSNVYLHNNEQVNVLFNSQAILSLFRSCYIKKNQ